MACTVIGLGYVGLTLSLKLASLGETVHAVDRKEDVIKTLLAGKAHISEPGLEEHLQRTLGTSFFPSTVYPEAGKSSTHILCVNTPLGADGKPDIEPLREAATALSSNLTPGDLVIVRSTVPPGATRSIVLSALEAGSGLGCGRDFSACVAPERTIEGNALAELGRLPQIIGGFDEKSAELASGFWRRVTEKVRVVSSMEAAELTKLLDNSYRYATFAIGNELGLACEAMGLDSREIIEAANWEYPRNDIKLPGAGVGGGCLPKDSAMLADAMRAAGVEPRLLEAARAVNEGMPRRISEYVMEFHRRHGIERQSSKILVLGFAFKGRPEVSDTRHSPGGYLSRLLSEHGYRVWGYDPAVDPDRIAEFGAVPCGSPEEGFARATSIIAMNDNPRWSELDLERLITLQANSSLVVDGWKVFDEGKIRRKGTYFKRLGNGRGERDR